MLLERLMASGSYPPGREAEFRKYLGLISAETARVGRIVSDLLSFSRRSKPQHAPADLNKLVRTQLSQRRETVGLNRLSLGRLQLFCALVDFAFQGLLHLVQFVDRESQTLPHANPQAHQVPGCGA